jgi:hypothetical protein
MDVVKRPRARAIQGSGDVTRLVSAAKGRVAGRPAIGRGRAAAAMRLHVDVIGSGKVSRAPLGRGRSRAG